MALGARSGDVVRLVLGQGLRVTAIGIVFGVAGALGSTRFLQSLLYEVQPTDHSYFHRRALTAGQRVGCRILSSCEESRARGSYGGAEE